MEDVSDHKDRFVTIAVVDTNGLLRGQKISGSELEDALQNGVGMSPAQLALDPTDVFLTIPGITDDGSEFSDSVLRVDASSRTTMPFERVEDSALYLAQFSGEASALCPRSILRSVVDRAAKCGLHAKIGVEMEYTLFNETSLTLAAKGFDNLETATAHASHDLIIYQNAQSEFYSAVADMCDLLGIRLAKMHEEIGGGFMESCIRAGAALDVCDQAVLFRNFLRVLAMRRGQTVCFMPRWSEDVDSQSSHLHISLLDNDGQPLFWDASAPDRMAGTFRHFLGGLQRFLPEVMLAFAPTVNSWRRFAPGTFAPSSYSWGMENRTTCLRVVGTSERSLRVENRLPCSDSNVYLATAATLAAGVAGIEMEIEPSECTIGNAYVPGVARGPEIVRDMEHAIDNLDRSLFAREWLGDRFVDGYCAARRCQREQFAEMNLIDERRRFFELG